VGILGVHRAGNIFSLLAISAFLFLSTTAAAETFYRWKDERGNPVHSDRPPPKGVDYEVVSTQSSLIRPVEGDTGAVPKKITPTAGNDFEPVETKEAMVEKNPEFCARARQNLETLDSSARIRLRDEQGEYRYLDEEEKQAQRQQALDTIEVHCE
jgi:hypothetical protein